MRASLSLKIHIAIAISLVFTLRLLFTGTCPFNTPENAKTGKQAVHFSNIQKHNPPIAVGLGQEKYAVAEVCEETPDSEEDLVRADSPVFLSFLYSPIFKTADPHPADQVFDPVRRHLPGKKYLALSILRI